MPDLSVSIRRIPLIFVFDAPNSNFGKLYQRLTGGLVATSIGYLADVVPALKGMANKVIIPMLVNPSSIDITKTAKAVKTLTKKGIVSQFYQAEPDVVSFSGIAGGQKSFLILAQLDNMLQTIEDGSRNIVTMIYKYGGVYKGNFENFRISTSADNPNIFNYSFEFHFLNRNHFRLFQLGIRAGTLNEAVQNPGKAIRENLKIAAKELMNNTGVSFGGF